VFRTHLMLACQFCSPSLLEEISKAVFRSCDSRIYTYFFPTYLLIPPKPGSGLYTMLCSQPPSSSPSAPSSDAPHLFWLDHADSSKEEDLQRKRQWRVRPEAVERLREIARRFVATHNFHNFTVGRDFSDRSTQRHMKSIEVSFVRIANGANRLHCCRSPNLVCLVVQSG